MDIPMDGVKVLNWASIFEMYKEEYEARFTKGGEKKLYLHSLAACKRADPENVKHHYVEGPREPFCLLSAVDAIVMKLNSIPPKQDEFSISKKMQQYIARENFRAETEVFAHTKIAPCDEPTGTADFILSNSHLDWMDFRALQDAMIACKSKRPDTESKRTWCITFLMDALRCHGTELHDVLTKALKMFLNLGETPIAHLTRIGVEKNNKSSPSKTMIENSFEYCFEGGATSWTEDDAMALRDVFPVISDLADFDDGLSSFENSYSPSEHCRLERIEQRLSKAEATLESLASKFRSILVTRNGGDSDDIEEVRKAKSPRVGRDRAYWGRLHPGAHPGPWYPVVSKFYQQNQIVFKSYFAPLVFIRCTPGSVVGIYDDGINLPSPNALFIAVCASQPDTLGELPRNTDASRYVAIAVVGEVPVIFSNQEEVIRFGTEEINRFVCINTDGSVGFWDPFDPDISRRVFGFAMRSHTLFDDFGEPLPFQGVNGLRVLVSHHAEMAAFRLQCLSAINRVESFRCKLENVDKRVEEHDAVLNLHSIEIKSHTKIIEELRAKLENSSAAFHHHDVPMSKKEKEDANDFVFVDRDITEIEKKHSYSASKVALQNIKVIGQTDGPPAGGANISAVQQQSYTSAAPPRPPQQAYTPSPYATAPSLCARANSHGGNANSRLVVCDATDSCAGYLPISALTPYAEKWTIKARITNKSELRRWADAKGEGTLFSVDLLDSQGSEIRGTFFMETADKFFPLLEEQKVYSFCGGKIKVANKTYSAIKNNYEITFDNQSDIHLCPDGDEIKTVQFNFVKIASLLSIEPNSMIDVCGVVKSFGDVQEINSTKLGKTIQKRDLTLIDDSETEVRLTLWGDKAANPEFECHESPVVGFKNLKVGDYQGRTLDSVMSTIISINPPEGREIYEWQQKYCNQGLSLPSNSISGASSTGIQGMEPLEKRKLASSIRDQGPDEESLRSSVISTVAVENVPLIFGPNGESYTEDKIEFLDIPEDCDWAEDAGACWSPIFEKWFLIKDSCENIDFFRDVASAKKRCEEDAANRQKEKAALERKIKKTAHILNEGLGQVLGCKKLF